jgi:hypothetical protein
MEIKLESPNKLFYITISSLTISVSIVICAIISQISSDSIFNKLVNLFS